MHIQIAVISVQPKLDAFSDQPAKVLLLEITTRTRLVLFEREVLELCKHCTCGLTTGNGRGFITELSYISGDRIPVQKV